MANYVKNHTQNRAKVCLLCFQKGSSMTQITGVVLKRVQTYFMENYNPLNMQMPNGICTRCRVMIGKVDKNEIPAETLPDPIDFSQLEMPVTTRSSVQNTNCSCSICKIATSWVGSDPAKFGKGVSVHKVGRPASETLQRLPERKPFKVCERCWTVLGKGKPHPNPCGATERRLNLHEMSLQDPRGRELEATQVVKEKLAEAAGTSVYVPMATGSGKPFNVQAHKPSSSKALFHDKPIPLSEWEKITGKAGLSNTQAGTIETGLRTLKGRKSFEPEISQKRTENDKEGSQFFAIKRCEMDIPTKNPGKTERALIPVFYCKDVLGLIGFIKERRGYHVRTRSIELFGFDKGGKSGSSDSLKMTLNVKKVEDDFSSPAHKRSTYKEGAYPKGFKDSGVKRSIIILFAEGVTESWWNQNQMTKLIAFSFLELSSPFITNDLSLSPKFCGCSTAMSTYPCPWCKLKRLEFGDFTKRGEYRTVGEIDHYARLYQEGVRNHKGKNKFCSIDYFNCENRPLLHHFSVPSTATIMSVMPPPELHILLGMANDFFDLIVDRLAHNPQYIALIKEFLRRTGLKRKEYFTKGRTTFPGQFAGDDCKTFLDKIHILIEELQKNPEAFQIAEPIIIAIKSFNNIRKQCFAVHLDGDYKRSIQEFAHLWIKCGRNITLKCHVLVVHVPEFLDQQKNSYPGYGLGFWAEQAMEGMHSEFNHFWEHNGAKPSNQNYESILFEKLVTFDARRYGYEQK